MRDAVCKGVRLDRGVRWLPHILAVCRWINEEGRKGHEVIKILPVVPHVYVFE